MLLWLKLLFGISLFIDFSIGAPGLDESSDSNEMEKVPICSNNYYKCVKVKMSVDPLITDYKWSCCTKKEMQCPHSYNERMEDAKHCQNRKLNLDLCMRDSDDITPETTCKFEEEQAGDTLPIESEDIIGAHLAYLDNINDKEAESMINIYGYK